MNTILYILLVRAENLPENEKKRLNGELICISNLLSIKNWLHNFVFLYSLVRVSKNGCNNRAHFVKTKNNRVLYGLNTHITSYIEHYSHNIEN